MPQTAQWVDQLRRMLGAERVDRILADSQRAAATYKRLQAEQGQAMADAWLARQRFPGGRFHASEAGHTVGIRG